MKFASSLRKMLLTAPILFIALGASAAGKDKKPDADNSAVNKRDRNSQEVTAQTQMKASDQDVESTRRIREALAKDDKLSVNAENIKIVTVNGVTTLKGPVNNADEKQKVEMHAKNVMGTAKVKSEIEIVQDKQ